MLGKVGSAAAFAIIYVFSAELYPTVVRNAAMGASSCCARVGSMIAPYITAAGDDIGGPEGKAMPLLIFGSASILAGVVSLWLPETLNQKLPETMEDGEQFGKVPKTVADEFTSIEVKVTGADTKPNNTTDKRYQPENMVAKM
ncbi:hypothetical protein ScPMuIL_012263 [Solemya velum]